jgi:hypothetical protein
MKIYVCSKKDHSPDEAGPWVEVPDVMLAAHSEALFWVIEALSLKGQGVAYAIAMITAVGGDWARLGQMPAVNWGDFGLSFLDPMGARDRMERALDRYRFVARLPSAALARIVEGCAASGHMITEREEGN